VSAFRAVGISRRFRQQRFVLHGPTQDHSLGVGKLRHRPAPVRHPMIWALPARAPRLEHQRGSAALSAQQTIRSKAGRRQVAPTMTLQA